MELVTTDHLIGVGETSHTAHNAEDVIRFTEDEERGQVASGIGSGFSLVIDVRNDIVDGRARLGLENEGSIINSTEIAGSGRLVFICRGVYRLKMSTLVFVKEWIWKYTKTA